MSNLFGNHIVGFLTRRLKCLFLENGIAVCFFVVVYLRFVLLKLFMFCCD